MFTRVWPRFCKFPSFLDCPAFVPHNVPDWKGRIMQRGTLYERHGAWHLRYRVNEIGPDGKPRRREITKKLCDADRRPMKEVQELADGLLAPANRGGAAEGSLTIAEFVSSHFLPFVAAR